MATDLAPVNPDFSRDEPDRLTPQLRTLLPVWMLKIVDDCPQLVWDMPHMELHAAAKEVFENELGKGDAVRRIRLAFWTNVEKAHGIPEMFNVYESLGLVCSVPRFRKICQAYPSVLAWLLLPPNTYDARLRELSMLGEDRMREILEASPIGANGKVDSRLAMVQVKLWEILQNRVYGAVVEKVEQKTLSAHTTPEQLVGGVPMNMEEIELRLTAIKERIAATTSPAPIRVDNEKLVAPTPKAIPSGHGQVINPGQDDL